MGIILIFLSLIQSDSLFKHYIQNGNLAEVKKLLETHVSNDTFLLAENEFFNYKFESAVELYKKVNYSSIDCNNALERIIFIKECNVETGIQDYVRAELLGRRGQLDEGLKLLEKLERTTSQVASYSILLQIKFFETLKKYENALKKCTDFINRFQESPKVPEVLLKSAQLHIKTGKQDEARKIYKEIILKYPESTSAMLARLQVR